jgi:hypothetical protein
MARDPFTRRKAIVAMVAVLASLLTGAFPGVVEVAEDVDDDAALMKRFDFLSQNGNVSCSPAFEVSIANMPAEKMLQGSCCSPMESRRYIEQIKGIRKYADISEIPPDPYNIPAGLARKLMPYYDHSLNNAEQAAYDFAMANSDMRGPCCCQCWRWRLYGGLGKHLIRDRQFTGQQLVDLWNIAQGCGGPTTAE